MENDDLPVSRILSRREVLALLGSATAALGMVSLAACAPGQSITPTGAPAAATATVGALPTAASTTVAALPNCIVRPEVTEGPYYVQEDLNRSDIRSDAATGTMVAGTPLLLTFNVSQISGAGCTPLKGVQVEVWHCDAEGVYSAVSDTGFDTQNQDFLRGYQMTDANGKATFTTIYPGWYSGRTVHIHFKVHPSANQEFTSQLFFDDSLTDQVFTVEPYAAKGERNTRNSNDNIYQDQLLVTTSKTVDGYAATFDIGMQMG